MDIQEAIIEYYESLNESILKHKEALNHFEDKKYKQIVDHIKANLKFDISVKLFLFEYLNGNECKKQYDIAKGISKTWLENSKKIGRFNIIENNTITQINDFQRCANEIFNNADDFDIIQEVKSGVKIYTI